MGVGGAEVLTQRSVDDLQFDAVTRVHSISRTIGRPRETFVFVSLRRLAILATADGRRRSPSGNALDIGSGKNPPRGFINAILLAACASAKFATRSFGGALL